MKFNREEKRKMVESIISRRRSIISISREYGIDYRELKRLVSRARAHGMDEVFKKKEYKTPAELIAAIDDYIDWYNNKRIQHDLKGMTPLQYRRSLAIIKVA